MLIRKIFWNAEEGRLRAAWRLVGQLLLFLLILAVLESCVGFFALGMLAAGERLTQGQLSDPAAVQSLFINDPNLMMILYAGMVPSMVISIWFSGRFLDRRPFVDFGFHVDVDWWVDFGFGLILGTVLMLAIFVVEWILGWITIQDTFTTHEPDANYFLAMLFPLITFIAVGFYEELFSRGYHLTNMAEGFEGIVAGPRGAILLATVLSSLVFGVLHAYNPNATVTSTVNISFAGIFLAAGYVLSGELAIPIGLHITWNFFQGNVFGFPVSGANFQSAVIFDIQQNGPEVWTGGAFGPEAGLLGLAAMVLGIGVLTLWVRRRSGSTSLHLSLAQPPVQTGNPEKGNHD